MEIKTITFEFEQIIKSTLTMNTENGFVMPTTGKELVQLVNEITNMPHTIIVEAETHSDDVELISYDIEEAK